MAAYAILARQAVIVLTDRAEFAAEGRRAGIRITEARVTAQILLTERALFHGSSMRAEEERRAAGMTTSDLRRQVRADLIGSEIFRRVTAKVTVSDREVSDYYRRNIGSYAVPRRRTICEALVPTLAAASALRRRLSQRQSLCRWLKGYASRGKHSLDSGEFVARAYVMIPALDVAAFGLPASRLSEPIPEPSGFYLVQPVGRVEPAGVIPFTRAQESIEEKLLQSKRSVVMADWVKAMHYSYAGRVALPMR